jgi:hypothetical protein
MGMIMILASIVLAAALPAKPMPVAGLHFLVGTWNCTYRAGAVKLAYKATYAYDLGGQTLRQSDSFAGGGAEQIYASDAQHGGVSAIVLDNQGDATIMRGTGSDPKHLAYHSAYPDASIAETVDLVSPTEYTIHATTTTGGKATKSVDTCVRAAQ